MSTFKVTVEQLTEVSPHPNADVLELAQVGLYRAVVPKGVYKTGDWALYIPEGAIVPDDLLYEMNLVGRLAGKEKNRVKAIRLRGELSQGLVCRPQAIDRVLGGDWDHDASGRLGAPVSSDQDFAEALGITKYVPEIPTQMAGRVYPAETLMRWPDIENIKRYPNMFEHGEPVVATEKVHGTCFLLTFSDEGDVAGSVAVSSKGYGSKGLAIERDPHNLYWRAVNAYSLEAFADQVSIVAGAPLVGLFGEVYGAGVQDLTYGADTHRGAPGFVLFDIAVDYGDGVQVFLGPEQFLDVVHEVNEKLLGEGVIDAPIETVPVLYEGPYDEDVLLRLAEGNTELGDPPVTQIREGLVVRPLKHAISPVTNDRKIGKIVSEAYLTRKNATEFE
jgi:RNA ligase (TIGR02306 family)